MKKRAIISIKRKVMPEKKTPKKKKTIKMSDVPIEVRAKAYIKANAALLEKYGLNARFVVSNRKNPGVIIKMALWVLRRTGSFVDIEFSPRAK